MLKQDVVRDIIGDSYTARKEQGAGTAYVNIALCKYWGKVNQELHLPYNSSISIALPYKTHTIVTTNPDRDAIILNDEVLSENSEFTKRTVEFLNLFRKNTYFTIATKNDLPTASGLASSASGIAALVIALNDLFNLRLSKRELSILARIGSGSAARSIHTGFVEWKSGKSSNESYAYRINTKPWNNLRIGLLVLTHAAKKLSSRQAMQSSATTSPYYSAWVEKCQKDIEHMKQHIVNHDMQSLGYLAQENCLAMHATAITASNPMIYWSPKTLRVIHQVLDLQRKGHEIYFTIDAGANVILLFTDALSKVVSNYFPDVVISKAQFDD